VKGRCIVFRRLFAAAVATLAVVAGGLWIATPAYALLHARNNVYAQIYSRYGVTLARPSLTCHCCTVVHLLFPSSRTVRDGADGETNAVTQVCLGKAGAVRGCDGERRVVWLPRVGNVLVGCRHPPARCEAVAVRDGLPATVRLMARPVRTPTSRSGW